MPPEKDRGDDEDRTRLGGAKPLRVHGNEADPASGTSIPLHCQMEAFCDQRHGLLLGGGWRCGIQEASNVGGSAARNGHSRYFVTFHEGSTLVELVNERFLQYMVPSSTQEGRFETRPLKSAQQVSRGSDGSWDFLDQSASGREFEMKCVRQKLRVRCRSGSSHHTRRSNIRFVITPQKNGRQFGRKSIADISRDGRSRICPHYHSTFTTAVRESISHRYKRRSHAHFLTPDCTSIETHQP
eukprot:scaffold22356_cov53-Attheya_sp.AAC.3